MEFLSLYSDVQQKLATGNISKDWEDIKSIPELYRRELPENLFETSDVKLSSLFVLNQYLRNYGLDDMEREIIRSNSIKE